MAVIEELRAEVEARSARPPRVRSWLPILVGVVALTVFGVLQLYMERRANSYWVQPPGAPSAHFVVDWPTIRYQMAGDLARFAALSIAGVGLVIRRRRWLFWMPAVAYTAGPLLFGWGDTHCEVLGRIPAAVGQGWRSTGLGCPSAAAAGWGPALLELALVLASPVALARVMRSRTGTVERPRNSEHWRMPAIALRAASLGLVGFAVWATFWAWRLVGRMPTPFSAQVPTVLSLLVFGALLATLHPRVAWMLPAVAILLATNWPEIPVLGLGTGISSSLWHDWMSSLPHHGPFVLLPVLTASWKPLARAIERLRDSPRSALLLLNSLNVADALFTSFALRSEGAIEVNPLVRVIGLPAKVLVVAVLSLALFRVRPRVLPWLVLAFSGVFVWHLAGSFASPA